MLFLSAQVRKANGMGTTARKPKAKGNNQRLSSDDFTAVAKRLGCDEDKATFEAKLGKIAKANLAKSKGKKV